MDTETIDGLAAFAERIATRRQAILDRWRAEVAKDSELSQSSHLSVAQFYDHIPTLLDKFEHELCATRRSEQADAIEEQKQVSASHGAVRWQQGYKLVEVMREWRHLHLCLVDELELDCANHPEVPLKVRAVARHALARLSTDGLCESSAQYAQLQQTEAAGRVQDLEQVIARLNKVERQRAEGWREAAHDLRGNLGTLKNVATVLNHDGVTEEDRARSVHMLKSGVDWMHAFLNDLMTLSRLEAGHESRSIERFDAAALLKDLCNSMRHLGIERGLFLTAQGPDELSVEGDKVKVRRIAQNLLNNALNYTESGGVKVEWRVDETPGTARWSLCVEDTGPGIQDGPVTPMAYALKDTTDLEAATPEAQPGGEASNAPPAPTMRSQSHVRAQTKAPGEGVGLSIVKRLCELLDASLELQTEPGKGTTFRVMFPLRYTGN